MHERVGDLSEIVEYQTRKKSGEVLLVLPLLILVAAWTAVVEAYQLPAQRSIPTFKEHIPL